ncbi:MAG: MFS transporter [Planctomycetes bacterium]|nr:MFS transporter [Planctomycetota bacterium]
MTTIDPAPPPSAAAGGHERAAIAALATVAFVLNLNTNVLGAVLPFARGDLALDGTGERYLIGAGALGAAIGALALNVLVRRLGQRAVLLGGLIGFAVLSVGHVLPPTWWPFLLLRFGSGLAVGVAYAAASGFAAEVAPYARRGRAMGMFTAGMFLAIPIGMPLAVLLGKAGHWQWIFLVQAALAVLGALWVRRVVPEAAAVPRVHLFGVLFEPGVLATLLATMLHVGSFFTTVQLATSWLDSSGIVAKDDQLLVWVGLGVASVLGSALLGRLSDRVGKRNFVLMTSAALVLCFGLLAQEPRGLELLLLGTLLAATAAARTGPLQALLSGLVAKARVPALMGLRGFSMQLGVVLFAGAAAQLPADGGFRAVLLLAAVCQLLSYVVIRTGARERAA